MYKKGDDIRQDQLTLQLIRLMDRLLQQDGLDLKLTPYRVLALGESEGIVEWVEGSMPISAVLRNQQGEGSANPIQSFLRKFHYRASVPYCIDPEVMDIYVRSCAGYCIVNYLLGIGDRHLDNLMLRSSGHFFHVDFGFIFGRDPKINSPMRFTEEMLSGMGGRDSEHYRRFQEQCAEAFLVLRQSVVELLSLVRLMVDANIPDLSIHQTPGDVLAAMFKRFRLDLTDEDAAQYILTLVTNAASDLLPTVFEGMHKLALHFR
jgi:phosphatidylinositol 3-kinase